MGILPIAPDKAQALMEWLCWLFYGPPGVGKTTLAAQCPKPLFLATEPGTALMDGVASVNITDWDDLDEKIKAIETESHGYATIVVDTVDVLFQMCLKHLCKRHGWNDIGDGAFGKGWRALELEWTERVVRLRNLKNKKGQKLLVVFISHERQEMIRVRRGSTEMDTGRFKVTSALPAKGRGILHAQVDMVIRCEMDENNKRLLRTRPSDTPTSVIEAKSRGDFANGRVLSELIPMSFDALREDFHKQFKQENGK